MRAQIANLAYVQGDSAPGPQLTFRDYLTRQPRDLTGYTATLAYRVNPSRIVEVEADLTQAASGIVRFSWSVSDLDTVGEYQAQVSLIAPSGQRQTFQQFYLSVTPRVTA